LREDVWRLAFLCSSAVCLSFIDPPKWDALLTAHLAGRGGGERAAGGARRLHGGPARRLWDSVERGRGEERGSVRKGCSCCRALSSSPTSTHREAADGKAGGNLRQHPATPYASGTSSSFSLSRARGLCPPLFRVSLSKRTRRGLVLLLVLMSVGAAVAWVTAALLLHSSWMRKGGLCCFDRKMLSDGAVGLLVATVAHGTSLTRNGSVPLSDKRGVSPLLAGSPHHHCTHTFASTHSVGGTRRHEQTGRKRTRAAISHAGAARAARAVVPACAGLCRNGPAGSAVARRVAGEHEGERDVCGA